MNWIAMDATQSDAPPAGERIEVRAFDGLSLALGFKPTSMGRAWHATLQGSSGRIHVFVLMCAPKRPRFHEVKGTEGPIGGSVFFGDAIFELPAESFAAARAWFEGLQLPERGQ